MELSNNVFISENQFYTLYWKCNAALNETKWQDRVKQANLR
jgi:hypothetical protein